MELNTLITDFCKKNNISFIALCSDYAEGFHRIKIDAHAGKRMHSAWLLKGLDKNKRLLESIFYQKEGK